jgi:hypothetical protein
MDRSRVVLAWGVLCLSLAGCAPSVGGLLAARGGDGDDTTVVNPTLAVNGPPEFDDSGTATFTIATTPAGQPIEASLDGGGYARIGSPWLPSGLTEGEHVARIRVAGAPGSEQVVRWTVDLTAPAAASGITVTAGTAGALAVTWTNGSDAGSGVASHTIDYGTAPGDRSSQSVVAAPAVTAQLTGLSACATYYVTVTCVDRAGNRSSATSEIVRRVSCGGDGAFATTALTLAGSASVIARGDFDSDGIVDAAVNEGNFLRILLGNGSQGVGDGTFRAGTSYDTGSYVTAIAVADVSADRIDDILLLNDDSLQVYLGVGTDGVGTGQFGLLSTTTNNLITPQALLVQDVDADRIADLVIGDWGGNLLRVFRGGGTNGRGNATFSQIGTVATGNAPGAIATGDFNADGILDLAVACQSGTEVLVTHLGNGSNGRGDGTFAAVQVWLSGGFVGGDVLVADATGDGIDDLLCTLALANAVCVLAGSGSGGRGTGTFYLDEVVGVGLRPWGLVSGDFNGDNVRDYVSLSYLDAGATLVAANGADGRPNGTFTTSVAGGVGSSLFHGVAADVDHNGSLDLLLADIDGSLVVLRGNGGAGRGDGGFAARGDEVQTVGAAQGVLAADFNSDRGLDLLVASYQVPGGGSEFVTLFEGVADDGRGTGAYPSGTLFQVGIGPTAFAAGDFDRNGILDVAAVMSDLESLGGGDRVDVLLGGGSNGIADGTLQNGATIAVGDMPRGIVAGDFNADAILDLAVANHASDTVTVLLGQGSGGRGNGTFTAQVPFAAGDGPFALACADVDFNGILDLVVGNVTGSLSGAVRVFVGQGTSGRGNGTFTAGQVLSTSHAVSSLGIGDFDADGILDLVGTNYRGAVAAGSGVTIYLGNGSNGRGDGTFSAGSEIAIGGDPRVVVVGDWNADGILDLAVGREDAGAVAILLGQGGNGRGNGSFGAAAAVAVSAPTRALVAADLDADGALDLVGVGGESLSLLFGTASY